LRLKRYGPGRPCRGGSPGAGTGRRPRWCPARPGRTIWSIH